jgi:hypothetical protein
MEENRIPRRVLYMNLGTTRLRGRPRNRWQEENKCKVKVTPYHAYAGTEGRWRYSSYPFTTWH